MSIRRLGLRFPISVLVAMVGATCGVFEGLSDERGGDHGDERREPPADGDDHYDHDGPGNLDAWNDPCLSQNAYNNGACDAYSAKTRNSARSQNFTAVL